MILVAIYGFLFIPLVFHRLGQFLWMVVTWFFLSYLVVNLGVFNLYGFHIDLVFLKMFFLDFKGMGIPGPLVILFAFLFIAIALVVVFSHRIAMSTSRAKRQINLLSLLMVILGVPIFILNQAIHAWGQTYHQTGITQYTPLFPLYYPVESSHSVKYVTGFYPALIPQFVGETGLVSPEVASHMGQLDFPKAPLQCNPTIKHNVLLVVVESWQAKTLRLDVMPEISSLLRDATIFDGHISSGTATVPGFFGLFYGLHPSYYESIRAKVEQYPAPLTEVVSNQGYLLRVFSSGDLERFSLRRMIFPRVLDENFRYFKDDASLANHYIEVLRQSGKKNPVPTFDVLYLTSSHSPYRYPEDMVRFQPLPKVEGAYLIDKHIEPTPFRNDYLNSLYYLDSLIGQFIRALKSAGQYDESWIILTGDHGEEFNESGLGLWGHGSSFSQWQTATPLVIKRPQQSEREIVTKPTFHQDLSPTLLQDLFGCMNPELDFSNGFNLRTSPKSRHSVINSYVSQAYWIDGYIWERNTGRHYSWTNPSESNQPVPPGERFRALLREESYFRKN